MRTPAMGTGWARPPCLLSPAGVSPSRSPPFAASIAT